MNILVIGTETSFLELKERIGSDHEFEFIIQFNESIDLEGYDLIFDFSISDNPEYYSFYGSLTNPLIFLNTITITLAELAYTFGQKNDRIFGFNGLPTFVNREVFEISSLRVDPNLSDFPFEYELVQDRIGMVTPRIVFMIINEAYFTVQEGTANKEAIDTGMKLGTNYPYGPFEWTNKIGIHHIFETLESLYEDTKDERYKIAPLLKQEYLMSS